MVDWGGGEVGVAWKGECEGEGESESDRVREKDTHTHRETGMERTIERGVPSMHGEYQACMRGEKRQDR